MRDALVLGIGNGFRRDDAVGLVLAEALKAGKLPGARVETLENGGPLLWERWTPEDRVLLLDAAEDGEPPGTLRVYDLMQSPPAAERARASSHGLGLVEAVELARVLGWMPRSLVLLTVTGADFFMGVGLSGPVRRALPVAEAAVAAVLTGARDFRYTSVGTTAMDSFQQGLVTVMHRFRDSFLYEGVHFSEDKVPFRTRPDFAAPLVTVLGHTYGLRLVGRAGEPKPSAVSAIEASVNVYDDEFRLERFQEDLRDIYAWSHVSRIIENFATPEDDAVIGEDRSALESFFDLDVDRDVEVVEKDKKTASNVTGRLVDTILKVRYPLVEDRFERLRDGALFVPAVYLYCLRPFAAAYRQSLASTPSGR